MRTFYFTIPAAVLVSMLFLSAGTCRAVGNPPQLMTVPHVDLTRYSGVWYEIARIEHFFQKGCLGSSATYTLLPNGEVEVINRCVNEADGALREAKGRAWSVDPVGNARLKVSFFWPFRGDYWIMELGGDYEYAVVGAPKRDYLWVLARQPVMEASVYNGIVQRIARQGFDTGRLICKPLPGKP